MYIDLAGYERDSALSPEAALLRLLRTLGDHGDGMPDEVGALAARYRSIVGSRRMIVVLDNASGTRQVLPLLPPDGPCAVVVTSRVRMASLDTYHPVLAVELGMFTTAEALTLLDRVVGADRLSGQHRAVRDIVDLCGHLPLALRIAASRLRTNPSRTAADLAEELSRSATRLPALATDDGVRSVGAAFDSTYRGLDASAARVFRLIGVCPGESISIELLNALHASAPADVHTLEAAHLIKREDHGRYSVHDLIRLFAAERARSEESSSVRQEWIDQIFSWYRSVGYAAMTVVVPHIDRHAALPPPATGLPFALEQRSILAWLTRDRHTVAAVVRLARETGRGEVAWQLADMLGGGLIQTSLWPELVDITREGLGGAAQLGDARGMHAMHQLLGVAEAAAGRPDIGLVHMRRAMTMVQPPKSDETLASGYNNIGRACQLLGRFDEARTAYEQAVEHYRRSRGRGLISTLGNLALLRLAMGDTDSALDWARQALETCREMGDTMRENFALTCLADVQAARGDAAAALASYRQALELHRRLGDRELEPATLEKMAQVHHALGEADIAASELAHAAELRRRYGL